MWDELCKVLALLDCDGAQAVAGECAKIGAETWDGNGFESETALHALAALAGSAGYASKESPKKKRVSQRAAAVVVRELIKTGCALEGRATSARLTAAHIAAGNGNVAVLEELLLAGAKLDAVDSEGHTPLHLAAAAGFRSTVAIILQTALDREILPVINMVDKSGHTPLGLAQLAGNKRVIQDIQAFLSEHVVSAPQDQISEVTHWLENVVKLPIYVNGFISQGYTRLELWAELGLSTDDFNQIGVVQPAHRKQITHFLKLYADGNANGSDDEDEDDEETSSESSG